MSMAGTAEQLAHGHQHRQPNTSHTMTPEAPPRAASPSTGGGGNPYTGAGDCNIHVAAFLGFLVALVLAQVLACAVVYDVFYLVDRCLRGRAGRERDSNASISDPENPAPPPSQLVYSAATTRLAGSTADCAICLAEFADGDAIRVMPACRHGFHPTCIQRWLAAGGRRLSCPTCRAPAPAHAFQATNVNSCYGDFARDVSIAIFAALHAAIPLLLAVIYFKK